MVIHLSIMSKSIEVYMKNCSVLHTSRKSKITRKEKQAYGLYQDRWTANLKFCLHRRLTNIDSMDVVSLLVWVLLWLLINCFILLSHATQKPHKSKTELTVVKQPLKITQKAYSCDAKQTKLMFLKLHLSFGLPMTVYLSNSLNLHSV